MDWRLITEERLDGPTAMAYDEVAAETVAEGGPATVRLYRWTPSTVSLGYANDADIIDWEFCAANGIDVTRRATGGGAIYHDGVGEVAYSIIAPKADLPGDVTASYRQLLEPVLSAFEAAGAEVRFAPEPSESLWQPMCYLRGLDPAHDLVGPDGRKVAGNAQHRTREAVVQHGSLTVAAKPQRHIECFADPPVDPADFESTVTGVGVDRAALVEELEASLAAWADADDGGWTSAERERAAELVDVKYDNDSWVRDRTDPT